MSHLTIHFKIMGNEVKFGFSGLCSGVTKSGIQHRPHVIIRHRETEILC